MEEIIRKTELTPEMEILSEIEAEARTEPQFHPFTLTDLYQEKFPEATWIAKDLIPLGGITAFTGESNSYKSFLALSLAASVVNHEPFLDHFPTTQGRVLVVDEENSRRLLRKHFDDLGVAPSSDILFVSQDGFRADVKASVEALRVIVEEYRPSLIILDSLIDIHTKNENDAPEMNAIFLTLRNKLLSEESAIIVIHHHRKEQIGQGSRPGQSMRGSSSIYGAIDAHISIRRKNSTSGEITISQEKLRFQEQLKPFKVSLVLKDASGHIAFAYQGEDTSKEDALLRIENAVLDLIFEASPEPMTVKALAEATGESDNAVRAAANALVVRGLATKRKGPHGADLFYLTVTDRTPADDSDDASPESDSDRPVSKPD